MKQLLTLFTFTIFSGYAQSVSLLKDIPLTKDLKIMGLYPQHDKKQTYKHLNFYIDDPEIIRSLVDRLTYGEEGQNIVEGKGLGIKILKGNEVVKHWLVSPAYSTIRIDGVSRKIDLKLLENLAQKYPFEYEFYNREFESATQYDTYLTEVKMNPNFLFSYEPDFEFEGSFEIEFPRNERFPNPKAIDDYLETELLKITSADNFNCSYVLDDYNRSNRNQFTITVKGNRTLYQKLDLKNLRQKNWKYNKATGMFFTRKP